MKSVAKCEYPRAVPFTEGDCYTVSLIAPYSNVAVAHVHCGSLRSAKAFARKYITGTAGDGLVRIQGGFYENTRQTVAGVMNGCSIDGRVRFFTLYTDAHMLDMATPAPDYYSQCSYASVMY